MTFYLPTIGDVSDNGQVTIIDEDRLCYQVKSVSKGAIGIRTISKALLLEFIKYRSAHPSSSANNARDALSGTSDIDKFEYGYASTLIVMADMALQVSKERSSALQVGKISIGPLQQIFYGAPGTGKSNTIKEKVEDAGKRHHRTTFHPDSDYSTFVGFYKPTMKESHTKKRNLTEAQLIQILKEKINDPNLIYPYHKFGFDYWQELADYKPKDYEKWIEQCEGKISMKTEIADSKILGEYAAQQLNNGITYEFVPQSFTKAYVDAWRTKEEVYLIIEEINRGNCAQIFGDLFQLLDRKNGISEYPIDADSDLENYLRENLKDSSRTDFPEGVKEGKKLVLPSNLYIWATMNTSDQSLFPIDSAFKRRWEWKYIPIKNHPEKNYKIEIGESKYDWWQFLESINREIGTITSSEDKKLGYFFAKAEDNVINDEQFVGKVLFYLWNDVFKNYGFDNDIFNKVDKEKLAFSDFFNADGSPNHENVNLFMKNLKVKDKNKKEETNTGEGNEQ